jgi:predicted DNA-binding transcriptional regulator YafY
MRDDFRMFRLDRIRKMAVDGTFRPERGKELKEFFAREIPPHVSTSIRTP